MKCKDCNAVDCCYRTSDAEKECQFQSHVIQVPDEWQYVRIQASIAAMQSIIAKCNINTIDSNTYKMVAETAVEQADALIKQLKEKQL